MGQARRGSSSLSLVSNHSTDNSTSTTKANPHSGQEGEDGEEAESHRNMTGPFPSAPKVRRGWGGGEGGGNSLSNDPQKAAVRRLEVLLDYPPTSLTAEAIRAATAPWHSSTVGYVRRVETLRAFASMRKVRTADNHSSLNKINQSINDGRHVLTFSSTDGTGGLVRHS